ncbi:MAG: flagellar basal body L-ring protein [Robiginitomaculum sp.]|nr:MAG: flagellar basal body L-ring protein [Robiginitomaculum sp.]
MNIKFLTLVFAGSLLGACSSAKIIEVPKSMPANWHMEDAPLPGRYSNAALRGTSAYGGIGHEMVRPAAKMTSLWSSSPKSLFGDRRASQLGDILTVVIEIDEEAELQNSVSTTRAYNNNLGINAFFGLPQIAAGTLPAGASLTPAVDISKTQGLSGKGNVKRKEKLTLRLAARVNAVLPNGYLGLIGRQEIMVNNEVRYLQVTGLIRVQDISRLNTVTYDKIAEARIFYGGQGQLTNSVKPKLGNKLLGKLLPF